MKLSLFAVVFFMVCVVQAEPYPDRFVFAHRNLAIPSQLSEMSNLVYNAAACGYNGIVFWCGRHHAGRWSDAHSQERADAEWRAETAGLEDTDLWHADRRARLAAANKLCKDLKCPLIPLVWSVGYCSMQSRDPNMTAAAPVRDVTYVRKGDRAVWERETLEVSNGGFETAGEKAALADWSTDGGGRVVFRDTNVKRSGTASARFNCSAYAERKDSPTARAFRKIKVRPNRRYRLSVWYKTKDLATSMGCEPRILVLSGETRVASRAPWVPRTQDWKRYEVIFNSLETNEVRVFVGAWGVKRGTLWADDLEIEPLGVRDVVRRAGAPVRVRDAATGRIYREGADYAPIPALGKLDFEARGEDVVLTIPSGSAIPPGAKLLVDCYEPVIARGVQYSACLANPALKEYYAASAHRIERELSPEKWLLSADEYRAGCRCELCTKAGSLAVLLAQTVRDQYEAIQAVHPGATCYVWSDMFDPKHNGTKNYFHCGDMTPHPELLPKDLVMVPWWDQKARDSFAYFSSLGFRTLGAAYYDQMTPDRLLANLHRWTDAMNATPNCRGILYTTWHGEKGHYEFLPLFAKELECSSVPKPAP